MALSAVKTFIAGEVLTASDLNALNTNILNNPGSLICPIGFNLTFTDATYDIGASGATRPRDLFLSRTATIGTSLDITAGALLLKSAQHQFFLLQVTNSAGTLQHRFVTDIANLSLPTHVGKISGASATLANTPAGSDGSTAFTSGVKVSSANATRLYLDTVAQTVADAFLHATIVYNDTGTDMKVTPRFDSLDINGTTRIRPGLALSNGTSGAGLDWNTTNIGASKSLFISVTALIF